jgi:ribose/xylose/arabinose/galactoside ABC-type transport system permease subunit
MMYDDNSVISIYSLLMMVTGTFVTRQHTKYGIMLGQICLYILFLLISVINSMLVEILHTHVYSITDLK